MATSSADDRATALRAELAELDAAISKLLTRGERAGLSDGTNISRVSYEQLQKRRNQVLRSLQRIEHGGRLISVNVSNATTSGSIPQNLQQGY